MLLIFMCRNVLSTEKISQCSCTYEGNLVLAFQLHILSLNVWERIRIQSRIIQYAKYMWRIIQPNEITLVGVILDFHAKVLEAVGYCS